MSGKNTSHSFFIMKYYIGKINKIINEFITLDDKKDKLLFMRDNKQEILNLLQNLKNLLNKKLEEYEIKSNVSNQNNEPVVSDQNETEQS